MEHFVVSARKYRPQSFKDVVGQQAITNTLLNAINHNHLAQALLFTGPRGVGKTTCARILAKMINDDGNQLPDEDFAFNIFELDAASNNSVDDIRSLIDQVRIPPQIGKYKVYIIDEVHMLSTAAFNAFLKTLEEPPKHAIFILATTEKHKIIPTILSRCQIFDFKRITVTDARNYLAYIAEQEGVNAEDDALNIIAQKADGAMRDALSIYDRVVSFSGNNLTRLAVTENLNVLDYETYLTVTRLILDNNIPQLLVEFNEILSRGFDGHHFIAGLASHFRDLLVCKSPQTINLLEVGETTKTHYFEQSQQTTEAFLMEGLHLANECDLKYKSSRNQRLLVELCLMQLASVTFDGEKKKSEPFIIPATHFNTLSNLVPSVKLSAEEKKLVRDHEYATGNSAPKAAAQLPNAQHNPVQQESSATQGLPDPEVSTCNTTPQAADTLVGIENSTEELPSSEIASEIPDLSKAGDSNVQMASSEGDPSELSENESISLDPTSVPTIQTEPAPPQAAPVETKTSTGAGMLQEKVSGLSIKSIRLKKEMLAKQQENQVQEAEVLREEFNETQLHAVWDEYIHRLKNKGEKILASILETDMPKIKGTVITIELPADTMKKDLERGQSHLMGFLKKRLRNTLITLEIDVNETAAKKYAFTNIEKFNKLKEKNPLIEKLRTTFDLDL